MALNYLKVQRKIATGTSSGQLDTSNKATKEDGIKAYGIRDKNGNATCNQGTVSNIKIKEGIFWKSPKCIWHYNKQSIRVTPKCSPTISRHYTTRSKGSC